MTAGLSACADSEEPQPPREAALQTCRNAAVQQFDLENPGDVAEPRELPTQDGESFEVTGSADELEWVCTWTRTESSEGITIQTSINER